MKNDFFKKEIDIEKVVLSIILYGGTKTFSIEEIEPEMFQDFLIQKTIFEIKRKTKGIYDEQQRNLIIKDIIYGDKKIIEKTYTKEEVNKIFQSVSREFILKKFYLHALKNIYEYQTKVDSQFIMSEEEHFFRRIKTILKDIEEKLENIGNKIQKKKEKLSSAQKYRLYIEDMWAKKNQDGLIGIPTPFFELNMLTKGFKEGEYIIIAGRPSMGKTSLALDFAYEALKNGKSVLMLSLEMKEEQIIGRMLPKITEELTISNTLFAEDYDQKKDIIEYATNVINVFPFEIEDFSEKNGTLHSILETIDDFKDRNGKYPDMVIIDYIQIIQNDKDETEMINRLSRTLAQKAKKTKSCFLILSQLNRNLENRENKRPLTSDLRGSGSLEQDADLIIFPFRELIYKEQKLKHLISTAKEEAFELQAMLEEIKNLKFEKSEIIVAKNRNGGIGTFPVFFERERASFKE